jgi:uncharacterized protein YdeI (YjbR/CyaY-like superfamily)
MAPKFFSKPLDFRKWLEKNHDKKSELLVGFWKIHTGKPSMTWSESVDQVLCFGWIDGVRKGLGEESYTIRFTPRKPGSIWSGINIKKIEDLKKKGLMHPAGIAAFEKRDEKNSRIYAYEMEMMKLDPVYEKKFKANKKAWDWFQLQGNYYKKQMVARVMTAKQEMTRKTRLKKLIEASAIGKKLL